MTDKPRPVDRVLIVAIVAAIAIVFAVRAEGVQRQMRKSALLRGLVQDVASLDTAIIAWRSRATIADYVRQQAVRRLQIGAGKSRREGWLNTDIEVGDGLAYLDATERFPLEDSSFNYVFSEHVIEHLPYEGGFNMLSESYRILVPGGKLRIATPNLLRFIDLFRDDTSEEARHYASGKLAWHGWPSHPTVACTILNLQLSSWGHRFVYDPDTLKAALTRVGFESIQEFGVGESDDPNLQGLELRQGRKIAPLNAYETMIFQAVKPVAPRAEAP